MERVFSWVATFAVALLVATAGLGIWLGDLHGQTDPQMLRWGTVHRLSGVLAALLVVLVNSMAVTYFIGTGRWCREVVETYGLDPAYIDRSRTLKRRAFPFALLAMLAHARCAMKQAHPNAQRAFNACKHQTAWHVPKTALAIASTTNSSMGILP
jgi:hypothetical protein